MTQNIPEVRLSFLSSFWLTPGQNMKKLSLSLFHFQPGVKEEFGGSPNFKVKYVDNFVKSNSGKMYRFSGKC